MDVPPPGNDPATKGLPPRVGLGNLAEAQHTKLLRSAKIAVMVVAVLTMGVNGFFYYLIDKNSQEMEQQVAAARGNPNLTIDQVKVTEARELVKVALLQTSAFFVVGAVFFGLFFMVNSRPKVATTAAFALYILANIAGAVIDPESVAKGLIMKLIIIAVLFKGMQAGIAVEKLREQEGWAHRS